MLHYAIIFFLIALIAAIYGFGGLVVGLATGAKVLCALFMAVAAITLAIDWPHLR
jgi:uncharacterized membrane protein YtjA (UPF0391 family)